MSTQKREYNGCGDNCKARADFSSLTGQTHCVNIKAGDKIDVLRHKLHVADDTPLDTLRLIYAGRLLDDGRTLADYGITHERTIHIVKPMRGGKPVIYLFSPQTLANATVSVRLVPQWSFSHVYPITEKRHFECGTQMITWTISVSTDGTLVEKDTGLELSYLFWEALSNFDASPPKPLSSPTHEGHDVTELFNPSCPVLEPSSSTTILLSFNELFPYLNVALKSLTLHTAARNDFITYWLPALSKKPYVALRFLPQAAYERAAELKVTPAPDVVTRVFMLFRGVPSEDAESGIWQLARDRVGEVDWPSVVGVKEDAQDKERFRVLEWGAMEVL